MNAAGEIVDSVSYLGRNNVWLGFVWNTNGAGIVGKGVTIDDVIVGMDDGRFDLSTDKSLFGYQQDEEIDWTDQPPAYGEEVKLQLDWLADGLGETPVFSITCTLDDQVIFEEDRQVVAGGGEIHQSETPGFWRATAGRHTLRWTLDQTNAVDETLENNNVIETVFEVPWVPPPTISFIQPDREIDLPADLDFDIVAMLADSNETDTSLTGYMFWTKDTSGFADDPRVMYNWTYIAHRFDLLQGEWTVRVNFEEELDAGDIEIGDRLFIAGFAADQIPNNATFTVAAGQFMIGELEVLGENLQPVTSLLVSAYPNPFNGELRIDYNLVQAGYVSLKIFDLGGRAVDQLLSENDAKAGRHSIQWKPANHGAGVYVVRLETPDGVRLQKAVYTP